MELLPVVSAGARAALVTRSPMNTSHVQQPRWVPAHATHPPWVHWAGFCCLSPLGAQVSLLTQRQEGP